VVATFIIPLIFFGLLFAVPFLGRNRERTPVRRPVAVGGGILLLIFVFTMLGLSIRETSRIPLTDPIVARGAGIYAKSGCSGCHRLQGNGGMAGPDLSFEGEKREKSWLIAHFKDPQSLSPGSFMPAVRLPDKDLEELTTYLLSLKK
jgi:ubiquinol-cytochrome c reductase cytochrome b subunit